MSDTQKEKLRFERDACPGIIADDVEKALKRLGLKVVIVKSNEDEIVLEVSR